MALREHNRIASYRYRHHVNPITVEPQNKNGPDLRLFLLHNDVQDPLKKLPIYKTLAGDLNALSEPYARESLTFSESDWLPGARAQEALRWFETFGQLLREWSTWDIVTHLKERDTIKSSLMKLRRAAPGFMELSSLKIRDLSEYTTRKFDIEETVNGLKIVLSSKEELRTVMSLQGEEAQSFINLLDSAMEFTDIRSRLHTQCFHVLRKLCGRSGLLPSSCTLSDSLEKQHTDPLMSGGFADIWQGTFEGRPVALKVLRIYGRDNLEKVKKSFCREAIVWKRLSHPNVLPFLGVTTTHFPLCMVCEWMSNGNVVGYLKSHPRTNRLKLLVDIAEGLHYLHSIGVVHGDIKGANILISNDSRACLADFGLTAVTYDPNTVNAITTSSKVLGSIRWMAPEIFHPEQAGLGRSRASPESDIYAVAMVIWEVFTGRVPFCEYPLDATVVFKVTLGIRPERPFQAVFLGLTDEVWKMMEACWQAEWQARPQIHAVLRCLKDELEHFTPPIDVPGSLPCNHEPPRTTFESDDSGDENVTRLGPDLTLSRQPPDVPASVLPDLTLSVQSVTSDSSILDDIDLSQGLEAIIATRPSDSNLPARSDCMIDEESWF